MSKYTSTERAAINRVLGKLFETISQLQSVLDGMNDRLSEREEQGKEEPELEEFISEVDTVKEDLETAQTSLLGTI